MVWQYVVNNNNVFPCNTLREIELVRSLETDLGEIWALPDPPVGDRSGRDEYGWWMEVDIEGVALRMRWIEPGTFVMGSPDSDEEVYGDEQPAHEVTLTEGYWIAETPCTQALWKAVMGHNPSNFKGDERPVEQVSYEDVLNFLETVNRRYPELQLGLPTEAQWEYACRAGSLAARYGALDDVAWYGGNSDGETHPVGQKLANAWGLYDSLGNVWEWCADYYGSYDSAHAIDPIGPAAGTSRVLRGGSWDSHAEDVRAAYRDPDGPASRYGDLGFRVTGSGVGSWEDARKTGLRVYGYTD